MSQFKYMSGLKTILWMIAFMLITSILIFSLFEKVEARDYTDAGCVAWAKDRAKEKLGIELPATGNQPSGVEGASNWWDVLPQYGYKTGSEPANNSLAIWRYAVGNYANYGHVAYVESVSGSMVTVTEGGYSWYNNAIGQWDYGYFNDNKGVKCRTQSKDQMANLGGCSGFLGYIYLSDFHQPIGTPIDMGSVFDVTITDANGKSMYLDSDNSIKMGNFTYSNRLKYMWKFEAVGGKAYKISNWSNGQVIDCAGAGSDNGTKFQTYSWNDTNAQKFYIYDMGNGFYAIEPACARGSALDKGGTNGSIHLWEFEKDNYNQLFTFSASGTKADIGSKFNAKITNGTKALYENTSGDVVLQQFSESDKRFIWNFTKNSDGSYAIKNLNDDKGLDCNNWGKENSTNISAVSYYGSSAQKWNIYDVGSGTYVLEPQCAPGRVADIGGTNYSIHLWEYGNENSNQRFMIISDCSVNGHSWDNGVITKNADCMNLGIMTYNCKKCNASRTEEIPAIGHSYKEEIVLPNKFEQGYTLHTCSVCGDSYKDNYTDYQDNRDNTDDNSSDDSNDTPNDNPSDNPDNNPTQDNNPTDTPSGKDSGTDDSSQNSNNNDSNVTNSEKITLSALTVTKATPSTNQITFTWSGDESATGYEIEYSVNADLSNPQKAYWNKHSLRYYRLTDLNENTTYYYHLRAYKGDGNAREYSKWTSIASVKTKEKSVTTEAPAKQTYSAPKITLKSVKNNKKKTMVVKWKWNVKADGYQISYAKKKNFSGEKKKNVNAYKESVTIKKLTKGKTYYVRIRAFVKDDDGYKVYGKWSSVKKVKIKK